MFRKHLTLTTRDPWDVAATVPFEVLLERMSHDDEKVRSAAAFAVGGVAAGETKKYFPILLDYVSSATQSHERTLILHAVKEVQTTISSFNSRSSPSTPNNLEYIS